MSDRSPFQSPENDENEFQSEAQRALERERQLPLTGWQQEVDQGLQLWFRSSRKHQRPYYFYFFTGRITSLCRN